MFLFLCPICSCFGPLFDLPNRSQLEVFLPNPLSLSFFLALTVYLSISRLSSFQSFSFAVKSNFHLLLLALHFLVVCFILYSYFGNVDSNSSEMWQEDTVFTYGGQICRAPGWVTWVTMCERLSLYLLTQVMWPPYWLVLYQPRTHMHIEVYVHRHTHANRHAYTHTPQKLTQHPCFKSRGFHFQMIWCSRKVSSFRGMKCDPSFYYTIHG